MRSAACRFSGKLMQTTYLQKNPTLWRRDMSDAAQVLEARHMVGEKCFFERLLDFSFRYQITQKYATVLYGLHLLLGLIVGVWFVFNGFQASTSQGLLTLLLALVAYFLVALFRWADNIARASGGGQS